MMLPPDFLASLQAASGDAALHVIAADWLDEHDQPIAAQLIRWQSDPASHRFPIREFIQQHADTWFGPWLAVINQRRLERCFVDGWVRRLDCIQPLEDFYLDHLDRLPLLRVLTTTVPCSLSRQGLARLATHPTLSSVQLILRTTALNWEDVAPFAEMPCLMLLELTSDEGHDLLEPHRDRLQRQIRSIHAQRDAESRQAIARNSLGNQHFQPDSHAVLTIPSAHFPSTPQWYLERARDLPHLTSVWLQSPVDCGGLAELPHLRELTICDVPGSLLRAGSGLPRLPQVQELTLKMSAQAPSPMAQQRLAEFFPHLRTLWLTLPSHATWNLGWLAGCDHLQFLRVECGRLPYNGLDSMPPLPDLRELSLVSPALEYDRMLTWPTRGRFPKIQVCGIGNPQLLCCFGPSNERLPPVTGSGWIDRLCQQPRRELPPGLPLVPIPDGFAWNASTDDWREVGADPAIALESAFAPARVSLTHLGDPHEPLEAIVPVGVNVGNPSMQTSATGESIWMLTWDSPREQGVTAIWEFAGQRYRWTGRAGLLRAQPWLMLFRRWFGMPAPPAPSRDF
ncbi:hypothetical protein [Tuwongella immobilis]|uniref:Uncharacterized protein n=1 Tax=Tuwongella immobilis TaxID=692036 RepID=A0A6C2YJY2_9BACT|nr:hypothetical protein [Tuwongella immobilis]VIP01413.1 unnamed protein product [Tuwongella immobilis]VTR98331.1 unnamed protein product [Tuwongella immobilis]